MCKLISIALIFAGLLFASFCQASYVITLDNGNTVTANSYRIDRDKVYLKYPVGEAVFPKKRVVSIKDGAGGQELLQDRGKATLKTESKPETPVRATSKPGTFGRYSAMKTSMRRRGRSFGRLIHAARSEQSAAPVDTVSSDK